MFSNIELKRLIVPLIIEQILVMFVGMCDTLMISYAGEAAISGVALVDMLNQLILYILAAIATGGAVIVSQYIGAKDYKNANRSAGQLLMITSLISILLMIVCLSVHKQILLTLYESVDVDVMNAALTYFVISALSFPFLGIYHSSAALFRSLGKTNITMYVSLLMNVLNLIGNAVGIFVFQAGVAGVAIPTLLSRIVAAGIIYYLAQDCKNTVYVSWANVVCYQKQIVKKIIAVAVPNGIENGLFQLGKVLVTSMIALFGTTQIVANGVANSLNMIAIIVIQAMNLAIVTIVGQCIGANEIEQAKQYTKKLMKYAYIATGILNIVVLLLLPSMLQMYSLSYTAYELTMVLVIMHNVMAFVLHPTSFILPNGLRAAGDVRYTMFIGIFSMLIFRLGIAYVFAIVFDMGILGIWIAMGSDWFIRSLAFLTRFRGKQWYAHKRI